MHCGVVCLLCVCMCCVFVLLNVIVVFVMNMTCVNVCKYIFFIYDSGVCVI